MYILLSHLQYSWFFFISIAILFSTSNFNVGNSEHFRAWENYLDLGSEKEGGMQFICDFFFF